MPKYKVRVTYEFEFDTDKHHDAQENPPEQNFDPDDRDEVTDWLSDNISIETPDGSDSPDSVEIVSG